MPEKEEKDQESAIWQTRLNEELERLQCLFRWGRDLKVNWKPKGSDCLDGQLIGDVIYIYSCEHPVEILRHEFLDALISKVLEPYQEICNFQRGLLNGLLGQMEERAYQRKEEVIAKLELLLSAFETLVDATAD